MKASPEVRLGCLQLANQSLSALKSMDVLYERAQMFIDFCELDEKFKIKPPAPPVFEKRKPGRPRKKV